MKQYESISVFSYFSFYAPPLAKFTISELTFLVKNSILTYGAVFSEEIDRMIKEG